MTEQMVKRVMTEFTIEVALALLSIRWLGGTGEDIERVRERLHGTGSGSEGCLPRHARGIGQRQCNLDPA